jgi:hypothetical protein
MCEPVEKAQQVALEFVFGGHLAPAIRASQSIYQLSAGLNHAVKVAGKAARKSPAVVRANLKRKRPKCSEPFLCFIQIGTILAVADSHPATKATIRKAMYIRKMKPVFWKQKGPSPGGGLLLQLLQLSTGRSDERPFETADRE